MERLSHHRHCSLLPAPFLGLAPLLPTKVVPSLVLVPRATARIHTPHDRERVAWETYGHLSTDYHVPDDTLIDLSDGLSPADWHLTPPTNDHLPPAQEGFVLAMGRAQLYKGFDDLLDALALLNTQTADYRPPCCTASTRTSGVCSRTRRCARSSCPPALNRSAASPSKPTQPERRPSSRPPPAASPNRSSTVKPDSLPHQRIRARTLTATELNRMRDQARRFAADRYDYPAAVRAFLNRAVPWLDHQPVERWST